MIEDISKSIKASMYERATSPLFGAFAISWSFWNYKTLLVFFSSMKVAEKITYIELKIYSGDWSLVFNGVIYPLISAVLFILIYPHPAKWIYEYWNKQQKDLKIIKQRIEDDTPLTVEESRNIRRELHRLESDHDDEITKKNNEIDRLKSITSSLEDEIRDKSQPPTKKPAPSKRATKPKVDDSLNEEQKQTLVDIALSDGRVNDNDYLSNSKFGNVKAEYYLEDLEDKGYLKRQYITGKGETSTLTKQGKKFAMDEGVVS